MASPLSTVPRPISAFLTGHGVKDKGEGATVKVRQGPQQRENYFCFCPCAQSTNLPLPPECHEVPATLVCTLPESLVPFSLGTKPGEGFV